MNRIKELRQDRDILQKDIANILGITQAQYSYIENNICETDYQGLIKLAFFYNTSIDYILGITNQNLPYPRKNRGTLYVPLTYILCNVILRKNH